MILNVKVFFKDVILAKEMGIWVLVSWGQILEARGRAVAEVSVGSEMLLRARILISILCCCSMCACWSVSYFNRDIYTVKGFF